MGNYKLTPQINPFGKLHGTETIVSTKFRGLVKGKYKTTGSPVQIKYNLFKEFFDKAWEIREKYLDFLLFR